MRRRETQMRQTYASVSSASLTFSLNPPSLPHPSLLPSLSLFSLFYADVLGPGVGGAGPLRPLRQRGRRRRRQPRPLRPAPVGHVPRRHGRLLLCGAAARRGGDFRAHAHPSPPPHTDKHHAPHTAGPGRPLAPFAESLRLFVCLLAHRSRLTRTARALGLSRARDAPGDRIVRPRTMRCGSNRDATRACSFREHTMHRLPQRIAGSGGGGGESFGRVGVTGAGGGREAETETGTERQVQQVLSTRLPIPPRPPNEARHIRTAPPPHTHSLSLSLAVQVRTRNLLNLDLAPPVRRIDKWQSVEREGGRE